jgi:hypothetical protein
MWNEGHIAENSINSKNIITAEAIRRLASELKLKKQCYQNLSVHYNLIYLAVKGPGSVNYLVFCSSSIFIYANIWPSVMLLTQYPETFLSSSNALCVIINWINVSEWRAEC